MYIELLISIVHCFSDIEENMAESIVAQLLYLDAQNHEDILFYINSFLRKKWYPDDA